MTGEFAAIEKLRAALPDPPKGEIWIGDDTAVVRAPDGPWLLLAADTVVAGVHADLSLTGIDDLGWKAVAANMSDVAAMGGRPLHGVVTVAGPPGTDLGRLYEGVVEAAEHYRCAIVGGDLANAPVLVVTVAVTGTVDGDPVLRRGARPGDGLWVTGALGASAAGLRVCRAHAAGQRLGLAPDVDAALRRAYARPDAALEAGEAARRAGATAMIDVSDGLAADLGHLADESGVGVRLDRLPVAPGATEQEALGGGEDYALLFSARDASRVAVEFVAAGLAVPLAIGVCTTDPAERTLAGRPLAPTGWEHDW